MKNDTNVTTSFTNGTIISMDALATKFFLQNLAITTIVECLEMKSKENGGTLENCTYLQHYDDLVDYYCPGTHGAVLTNMLDQNAKILYRFVEDCVLNNTIRGLYLLHEKTKYGEPCWKLITLALDKYMNFLKKEYEMLGKRIPDTIPNYTAYNEKFTLLMEKS